MTAAVWVALAIGVVSAVINTVSIWFAFRTVTQARLRDNSDRAWRRATWTVQLLESDDESVSETGLTVLDTLGQEYMGTPNHEVDKYDQAIIISMLTELMKLRALEYQATRGEDEGDE